MTQPAGSAPSSANTAGALPTTQWRSATEHDVYADNRDEDIFGWIQSDEWDTVAGPNKNNFLRGDCVECVTDQDKSALPQTLQSCGGPSCGYGGQCCEYSRRATHTKGPSELAPAFLLQRTNKAAGKSKIEDLAKVEQNSSLGVSLIDIIHGRSCRPISLLDLRTFLHFQRQPYKRLPSYYPASDMQSSAIDNFDLNLDLPTTSPPSPRLIKEKQVAQRLHYDEVDALDFLVAYERYLTKFRDQSRVDRLKSPNPATCKAAVRAYVRRQCKGRVSSDLTAMDVLLGENAADDDSDIPEEVSREVLARLKPTDLGLKPDSQPLRVEFDRMVHHYLCSRRTCILSSTRKGRRKRDSGSSSDTAAGGSDTPNQLGSSNNDKMPRLRWMVDVGLISESDLQLALAECDYSTHPEVLAPIAEAVYAYMSQHVVPFFFIAVARNLSPNTKRGRLLVGIVYTVIALAFTILLIITPSPLAPHANHSTYKILRWWRLLTAPIWCAGLGYILAYFTGLCVWLTLCGNREPDEEEEREREEIRSRISGEDVVGFDLAELQAAVDERDMDVEQDTNRWMAPEIAEILTGFTGQKKEKQKRQRSSSDVRGMRSIEEGRGRSRSEVTDTALSTKVSFEQSLAPEKFLDASNGISSPSGLASPLFIEKDLALTMPAAVIGSPHSSPPPATRRKSLAHALLPLKSSNRMQAQMQDMKLNSPTRERSGESDMEKEDLALPTLPEPAAAPMSPLDPREIAPWSAPSAVSIDLPSSARPLLFSLPANRKSRLSATTSTTAVGPTPAAASGPKRAYDDSPSKSLKERLWTAVQRGTGFAVGTERVLDARVRRTQQMKALRIMALNTLATVVVVVIVVAIP